MHTPKSALLDTKRVIYLTNTRNQIMFAEFPFAERACEEASLIALFVQVNQVCA
jgi:hypothetical protein